MTGRPGCRTMEMIGGSSASYLARPPCVSLFCTLFNRDGNRRTLRLPVAGRGSFPLYGWSLCPVIFGVEKRSKKGRKKLKKLEKGCFCDSFLTFLTFFNLFDPGAKRPREPFCPKGPNDSCNGPRRLQLEGHYWSRSHDMRLRVSQTTHLELCTP